MKNYPFDQIVVDSTSKFHKIKKEDYLPTGQFKIVDQSKEHVAGYTNNAELVNNITRPIIIFGDHTKIFKFIDFPLALGADGAKALTIKDNLANSKYLYYYFKTLKLTDAGYSRHFKFLKEVSIPLPDTFDDQIRIATVLTRVEKLISKRKESIKVLDELLKSTFLEMFGDPVRNEKGWNNELADNIITSIISGTSYGGSEKKSLENDELGVLKISAVTQGRFNQNEFKAVKKSDISKKIVSAKKGMFLFSRANTKELVAACCIVDQDYPTLFLPDKLWSITVNNNLINPWYLNFLFKNENFRNILREKASGGHDSMLNISMQKLRALPIPTPTLSLQNKFATIVEKIESLKSKYTGSLTELENLYGSLSQRAFKGELDLSGVVVEREEEVAELQAEGFC